MDLETCELFHPRSGTDKHHTVLGYKLTTYLQKRNDRTQR